MHPGQVHWANSYILDGPPVMGLAIIAHPGDARALEVLLCSIPPLKNGEIRAFVKWRLPKSWNSRF